MKINTIRNIWAFSGVLWFIGAIFQGLAKQLPLVLMYVSVGCMNLTVACLVARDSDTGKPTPK